jgi:hypothetical protein
MSGCFLSPKSNVTAKALGSTPTTVKFLIDKVSIEGCDDIADFLKEISKESSLTTL